jgi:tetratricopeptide (TPR) repeat protein
METRARNNLFYLLRADAEDARRARRRLAVGSAFAVFLGGLLTAVGLAIVVLAVCLSIVTLVGCAAAGRALRRNRDQLRHSARSMIANVQLKAGRAADRARGFLRAALRAGRAGAAQASSTLRSAGRSIAQSRPRRAADVQHEALRLNVAGTMHRRTGSHEQAIELHRRALEILSDGGDPRAVALTQNNLALAMSHAGDDSAATSLFEVAAATVRELGDREQEGKIMANLALAHRRHGRERQCEETLRLALTRLRRDSSAYRRVEAELRRVA